MPGAMPGFAKGVMSQQMKTIGSSLAALLISTSIASACSVTDIAIKQADWRLQTIGRGIVTLEAFGEIKNNCAERTQVKLHHVFKDAAGKVVTARDDWATSTGSVGPGESYGFSYTAMIEPNVSEQIKTLSSTVLETHAPPR